jgi:transposase-like protein
MKYDEEFKRNAVRKVLDGQSVRSVSQELGVNESQIHTAVDNEQP